MPWRQRGANDGHFSVHFAGDAPGSLHNRILGVEDWLSIARAFVRSNPLGWRSAGCPAATSWALRASLGAKPPASNSFWICSCGCCATRCRVLHRDLKPANLLIEHSIPLECLAYERYRFTTAVQGRCGRSFQQVAGGRWSFLGCMFFGPGNLFFDLYMFFGPNRFFFDLGSQKMWGTCFCVFWTLWGYFFWTCMYLCWTQGIFFDSQINCF